MNENRIDYLTEVAADNAGAWARMRARQPMRRRGQHSAEDTGSDWVLCGCIEFWTLQGRDGCYICDGTGRRSIRREQPAGRYL